MLKFVKFFGTIKQFKMPDLGEKIKEATVVKWHVKEGDLIQEFDSVADVSTDKMFTQIPSTYSGKIHKRFHQEQDVCQVGELFLEIDSDEVATQKPTQSAQSTQQPTQKAEPKQQHSDTPILQRFSPSARYHANQRKIDITTIKGTGLHGTITKEDVQNHQIVAQHNKAIEVSEIIKMTDFQKGMQKSMTSAVSIPHLYLQEEIDVTNLSSFREMLKKQENITFMTLFIKSFSLALFKFPILNSTYDESKQFEYITHNDHNISIALDSPRGLVVPNIKKVQNLSISAIQKELNQLRKLGDEGKLGPKELGGGTICISNIGTIAGTYLGPIILAPQVCIIGLGRVVLQPQMIGGQYKPRKILYASFGCDHRVLDGATVTRFSNEWKNLCESPEQMLLKLN